ncbi:hypothetical protein KEU06_06720 [Pseudaminobacter sp. 19-2017]|uniref:Uncharacterized protein n=1 Tax=Pseudaminobacter soli (ex Zhang et al. 2022) TaxID=2831468 RepID=A0A942I2F5_9HYPH|nr:hypothetical protein [Pseudaminobacter soli]MBS3648319.1 hypothetical protein [Pseudaminobacter soli]
MKISSTLSSIAARLFEPVAEAANREIWCQDPLAHPVLSEMTARELGDLPFERRWRNTLEQVCSASA